ncbi:TIGR03790 family protein [Mucilaginibacter celer]|uniref:TIGR03790 family protein n=1 Tax=Mucilaginibacter celer TaxID=2305508 RepID=A0A494VZ79_9SPHI|nr:TIGR03790 family protein [Mucilaginibacter celer]AYL96445.1 TIGR03790 family protein [Mucilaginibacter celer]
MKKLKIICCVILLALVAISRISAQTATLTARVLVVRNSKSPISVAIAADYMKRRQVSNLVSVSCPDGAVSQDAESINYPDYVTAIETPIRNYLKTHTEIDFIVFTKGVPIRVYNTPGKPYGGVCSLDSRIATLGYETNPASSIINVSDPNYGSNYVGNAWANKYFNSEKRFSHAAFGGYLVTRLDGYTQADAIAVTTRSLEAEKNMLNNTINQGLILLDACFDFGFPNKDDQPYTLIPAGYKPGQKLFITRESVYGEYNSDMSVAHDYLVAKKIPVLYDSTNTFVGHKSNLMGYISWGSNDTHYDPVAYNTLRFAAGALCETAVSTSARTFLPTTGGQSLIDDIVKQGVTGVKGYTDEPLLQGIASPSILFNRYTRGWTLAESYYAASRLEGWMGIVIGDPICRAYADPTIVPVEPDSKIVLYPNPSADTIHVNLDGDHLFKIYDMGGKLLKSGKLVDKQIIIRDLSVGVYVVTISTGCKEISRKIIRKN